MDVELRTVGIDAAEAVAIQERYLDDIRGRYGDVPGCVEASGFTSEAGRFVLALVDGDAVACAGIRPLAEDHGPGDGVRRAELKRCYVDPQARGRGLARRLLSHLESAAAELGYVELWLETGTEQPEAMALYASSGYDRIPNYGEFEHDDRSRCFGKALTTRGR